MVETRRYAISLVVRALVAVVSATSFLSSVSRSQGRDQARRRSRRTSCASTVIRHVANPHLSCHLDLFALWQTCWLAHSPQLAHSGSPVSVRSGVLQGL